MVSPVPAPRPLGQPSSLLEAFGSRDTDPLLLNAVLQQAQARLTAETEGTAGLDAFLEGLSDGEILALDEGPARTAALAEWIQTPLTLEWHGSGLFVGSAVELVVEHESRCNGGYNHSEHSNRRHYPNSKRLGHRPSQNTRL